jgi:hypothetical protein
MKTADLVAEHIEGLRQAEALIDRGLNFDAAE